MGQGRPDPPDEAPARRVPRPRAGLGLGRDDKLETMERQIDLAADHGIAFFAICWHFIPEVTAGWDKRPWERERGLSQKPGWYFPDRTPQTFGKFLQSSV